MSKTKIARQGHYRARKTLRKWSTLKRPPVCCHRSVLPGGHVQVRQSTSPTGTTAGYGGLSTCGSWSACPRCASKIAAERADTISRIAWQFGDPSSSSVAFMTFTMRHRAGQPLAPMWADLSKAWNAVTNSRAYKADKDRLGVAGWVRAVEATHGVNGWHLHLHVLVFFDAPISEDALASFGAAAHARFARRLRDFGRVSLASSGGFDCRRMRDLRADDGRGIGQYLSKSLGYEVAGGQGKQAGLGGRTPFKILEHIGDFAGPLVPIGFQVKDPRVDDVQLWQEWERAAKGKRQLTWSRGLLARFEVVEREDEEVAAEDLAGNVLAVLSRAEWAKVRADEYLYLGLLEAAESAIGSAPLLTWCALHSVTVRPMC